MVRGFESALLPPRTVNHRVCVAPTEVDSVGVRLLLVWSMAREICFFFFCPFFIWGFLVSAPLMWKTIGLGVSFFYGVSFVFMGLINVGRSC